MAQGNIDNNHQRMQFLAKMFLTQVALIMSN